MCQFVIKNKFMNKYFSILLLVITTGFYNVVQAQENEQQNVQKVIEMLFDGMRSGDSSMVSKTFTNDAIMQTVMVNREGETIVNTGQLQGFLNAVGAPKNEVWDERIGSYTIHVDDKLASAWAPYSFYRGESFSHCGVNSFQLVKKEENWKIFFIVDTRRGSDCVE